MTRDLGGGSPAGLIQRAENLALELVKREVDRAELRRIARYLGRERDMEALRRLLACPPPRRAGRGEEHWRNLRQLVSAEADWCLASAGKAGGTAETGPSEVPGEPGAPRETPVCGAEPDAVARLEYVLGWAGRLQQFYEAASKARGKTDLAR